MKIAVMETKNETGGSFFTVAKAEENLMVGTTEKMKIADVVETVGRRLLEEHNKALQHQLELKEIFTYQGDITLPFKDGPKT